jgi:hypothetical protein
MRSPFLRALASAALLIATGSCGSVTDATPPRPPAAASDGLLSTLLLPVVQRLLPLSSDQSASAVIGTGGGTISIPKAGFSITFPAGAVSAPVTVTATAVAGSNVAYRFEPHGLVFQKQPVISQDLSLTNVAGQLLGLTLQGGYFASDSQLGAGYVTVTETRPATIDLLRLRMTFSIGHFSGYACTRQGGYMGVSGDRTADVRGFR